MAGQWRRAVLRSLCATCETVRREFLPSLKPDTKETAVTLHSLNAVHPPAWMQLDLKSVMIVCLFQSAAAGV